MKASVATFMRAFGHSDLGGRIHELVRAVADGFTLESGREQFARNATLFVRGDGATEACRDLYLIRNNAEHFNEPDKKLDKLPARESFVRAMKRAHEAEALARYSLSRLVENPGHWAHWRDDDSLAAFWKLSETERRGVWGPALDLTAAMRTFDPSQVPPERA